MKNYYNSAQRNCSFEKSNENNDQRNPKLIFLETHNAQAVYNTLLDVFGWLERYITRTKYPNLKKQTNNERIIEIKKQGEEISAETTKKNFTVVLFAFINLKQQRPQPD